MRHAIAQRPAVGALAPRDRPRNADELGPHLIAAESNLGSSLIAITETARWRSPKTVMAIGSERSDAGCEGVGYLIFSSARRDGPFSTRRWALWSSRSQTASAMVGSPRYS